MRRKPRITITNVSHTNKGDKHAQNHRIGARLAVERQPDTGKRLLIRRSNMTPTIGDIVQFKNNNRDAEPLVGMVASVHDGTVDLNIFFLGRMEFRRNVKVVEDAASAEAGQCWLLSAVKRS
jgi:hypothetical protein